MPGQGEGGAAGRYWAGDAVAIEARVKGGTLDLRVPNR
jgi:hypothetical protein